MALGDYYASLAELKTWTGVRDTDDDTLLNISLRAACVAIEQMCNRQFNDAVTPTARVYEPDAHYALRTDDFWTATGLVIKVDDNGQGTFGTTLTAADYELHPLNNIVNGQLGWPFNKVLATRMMLFPMWTGRKGTVQVTARWGWQSVPEAVHEATLIAAAELWKSKDAPFGIAGFSEFGSVRLRDNPKIVSLLRPYRQDPVLVG